MSQELQVVEESEEELICVIGDQEYMVDLETMLVFAVVPGSDEDPAEAGTWDSDKKSNEADESPRQLRRDKLCDFRHEMLIKEFGL